MRKSMVRFPAKKGNWAFYSQEIPCFLKTPFPKSLHGPFFSLYASMLQDFLTHGAVWSFATKVQESGHVPIIKNT